MNLSVLSKITPRYLASSDGLIVVPSTVMPASVDFQGFCVKWTRTYSDCSNYVPWFVFHLSASLSNGFNLKMFPLSVSPAVP